MTKKRTPNKYYIGKFKTGVTYRIITDVVKKTRFLDRKVPMELYRDGKREVTEKFARMSGIFLSREDARVAKHEWEGKKKAKR
jgi:hypothetical protein